VPNECPVVDCPGDRTSHTKTPGLVTNYLITYNHLNDNFVG